jgi:hypothetical protein
MVVSHIVNVESAGIVNNLHKSVKGDSGVSGLAGLMEMPSIVRWLTPESLLLGRWR